MKEALNTEPSAVAPDATVNFVVEQIAEHVKVQFIAKLSLASGASTTPAGLPRWGPRSALGSVKPRYLSQVQTDPLPGHNDG
jgi:hypothetical protein